MKNKRILFTLIFLCFITGFVRFGLCQDKEIVAKVNGKPVTSEYFNAVYENFLQQFRAYNPGSPIDKETIKWAKRYVLDEIIKRELILQEAKKMKFKINISDAQVESKIKEDPFFKGKDGKFDKTKYLWALNNPDINWKQIRESVRKSMEEEMLVEKFQEYMMNKEKVSDTEVLQEYVKQNEKMKIQYTIIKPAVLSDTEVNDTEAQEKANKIKTELKDSAEFETVVRENGETPSEVIFTRFQYYIEGIGYVPEFVETSFDSAPGEVGIINAQDGICVYKIVEKIGIDKESFAKEKENLRKSFASQKNIQAFNKWYEDLRARSKITIYLEDYNEK